MLVATVSRLKLTPDAYQQHSQWRELALIPRKRGFRLPKSLLPSPFPTPLGASSSLMLGFITSRLPAFRSLLASNAQEICSRGILPITSQGHFSQGLACSPPHSEGAAMTDTPWRSLRLGMPISLPRKVPCCAQQKLFGCWGHSTRVLPHPICPSTRGFGPHIYLCLVLGLKCRPLLALAQEHHLHS